MLRAAQDVNKEPGAEDKFKRISEAYEVHSLGVGHACRSAVASRDARRGVAAPPRATYWAQPVCVELCIHLQVLSDDKKRAIYDQFGEAGLKGGLGGGAGGPGGVEFTNPFDLFESFFGAMGGRRSTPVQPGDDQR